MDNPNDQGLLARLVEAVERLAEAAERDTARLPALLPEALSKAEAARFLGVDETAIEQLIRTRKLAYVQYGSQRGRVILVADLRKFLAAHRQATGEEMAKTRRR